MEKLDDIREQVIKLYEEDNDTKDIAQALNIPNYLVESILISEKEIYFR